MLSFMKAVMWFKVTVAYFHLLWLQIIYSRRVALVLHNLPVVIFLLMPLLLQLRHCTVSSVFSSFLDLTKGMLFHISSSLLNLIHLFCPLIPLFSFWDYFLVPICFLPCNVVKPTPSSPFILQWNFFFSWFVSESIFVEYVTLKFGID